MSIRRYLITTILSAFIMLMLSFIWHGVILNDFRNISLPFPLFIGLSVLVYSLISIVLLFVIQQIKLTDTGVFKRFLIGGAFGFFIYLVVFTLGMSYLNRGMEHVVIDFVWQMLEQGVGGVMIAINLRVYERMDALAED